MINFERYTREAIQKDMLAQVDPGIDTREGSIIQAAVGPVAWYLEGLYLLLAQVQENAYATTAVGQYLDYKCAERGITRKAAVAARRKGVFNVEVPIGAAFRTINGANSVIFVTVELIERTQETYTYEMVCQTPGTIGNLYTGELLPVTAVQGLTSAYLGEIILAGSEEEDDDALRNRYFATFDTVAFGGNIISYRTTILGVEGVGAVQVYPAWKGGGTVLCSILNSQYLPADNGTIEKVQGLICPYEDDGSAPSPNGYGMAPIGAAVTIVTAKIRTLNVECNVQFADGITPDLDAYEMEIEEKIEAYLASVRREWGTPLKGNKIDYSAAVYIARISAAILDIEQIVNVTNILINEEGKDLVLTETADLQEVPTLGTVTIHG